MVRYANDIVVLCHKREEAEIVLGKMKEVLEKRLRLKLTPRKTRITQISGSFDSGLCFQVGIQIPLP